MNTVSKFDRISPELRAATIKQIMEIDRVMQTQINEVPKWAARFMGGYTNNQGEFVEGLMHRIDKFGNDIFLSDKQCLIINNIHEVVVQNIASMTKKNRYSNSVEL